MYHVHTLSTSTKVVFGNKREMYHVYTLSTSTKVVFGKEGLKFSLTKNFSPYRRDLFFGERKFLTPKHPLTLFP